MAVLQVLKGKNPGQLFPLDRERSVLGRHPDCDIVLDAGAVSRQHAQILHVGDEHLVEDLDSRNGTFVNGQLTHGRHRLEDKDRLKICDLLFTFHQGGVADVAKTSTVQQDSGQLLVDDTHEKPSTIMAKVSVSSTETGLGMEVKPEVKMRALYDIMQAVRGSLDLDEVMAKTLDALFRIFMQADRGFIILRESVDAPIVIKAVKHRRESDEEKTRISRTIINQVMESREAVLSADAASDSRFDMSQSIANFRIRSMMCAPLVDSDGNALGVIQVDTLDQRSRFREDDLVVLATVALQAAIVVENAQLHEDTLRQQAVDSELQLARRVQRGFLPDAPPRIDGYDFFDFYEPAKHVGGDYYDYIPLPGNRLAVILADVSGKEVPAAMLMAKLSAEMRYGLISETTPAAALNVVNRSFSRGDWEDRFVTSVAAILDPGKHEVTLVNAGHMPPLLRHSTNNVEEVGDVITGVPLGVSDDYRYEQTTFPLAPGESLTLFTDGISEAMNADSEIYGLKQLRSRVAASAADVFELGKNVLGDVKRFVGDQSQSDDMCLVMFGRGK